MMMMMILLSYWQSTLLAATDCAVVNIAPMTVNNRDAKEADDRNEETTCCVQCGSCERTLSYYYSSVGIVKKRLKGDLCRRRESYFVLRTVYSIWILIIPSTYSTSAWYTLRG